MTRRKGELSANKIGRERPEQVARLSAIRLRASTTTSSTNSAESFRCVRAGTRCGGMMSHTAFSVSPMRHAEGFCARFGGERFDSEGSRSRQRVVPLAQELSRTEARSSP